MTWLGERRFKLTVTKYERRLCEALKREGIPFTPQAKIKTKSGRTYTVDIFIQPTLIIEVGYVNPIDIQEHEDLKQTGYTVLHFPNKEIERKLNEVVKQIKQMCQNKKPAPTVAKAEECHSHSEHLKEKTSLSAESAQTGGYSQKKNGPKKSHKKVVTSIKKQEQKHKKKLKKILREIE